MDQRGDTERQDGRREKQGGEDGGVVMGSGAIGEKNRRGERGGEEREERERSGKSSDCSDVALIKEEH